MFTNELNKTLYESHGRGFGLIAEQLRKLLASEKSKLTGDQYLNCISIIEFLNEVDGLLSEKK